MTQASDPQTDLDALIERLKAVADYLGMAEGHEDEIGTIHKAATALSRLREAEKERDHFQCAYEHEKDAHLSLSDKHSEQMNRDAARILTAEAEVARLVERLAEAREALRPFAEVAEHDIGESETDADLFRPISRPNNRAQLLTVGDLRRARAVWTLLDEGRQ